MSSSIISVLNAAGNSLPNPPTAGQSVTLVSLSQNEIAWYASVEDCIKMQHITSHYVLLDEIYLNDNNRFGASVIFTPGNTPQIFHVGTRTIDSGYYGKRIIPTQLLVVIDPARIQFNSLTQDDITNLKTFHKLNVTLDIIQKLQPYRSECKVFANQSNYSNEYSFSILFNPRTANTEFLNVLNLTRLIDGQDTVSLLAPVTDVRGLLLPASRVPDLFKLGLESAQFAGIYQGQAVLSSGQLSAKVNNELYNLLPSLKPLLPHTFFKYGTVRGLSYVYNPNDKSVTNHPQFKSAASAYVYFQPVVGELNAVTYHVENPAHIKTDKTSLYKFTRGGGIQYVCHKAALNTHFLPFGEISAKLSSLPNSVGQLVPRHTVLIAGSRVLNPRNHYALRIDTAKVGPAMEALQKREAELKVKYPDITLPERWMDHSDATLDTYVTLMRQVQNGQLSESIREAKGLSLSSRHLTSLTQWYRQNVSSFKDPIGSRIYVPTVVVLGDLVQHAEFLRFIQRVNVDSYSWASDMYSFLQILSIPGVREKLSTALTASYSLHEIIQRVDPYLLQDNELVPTNANAETTV